VPPRRNYNQNCPIARGLDVLGERWTLLILRELVGGARRYGDLRDALPGVATNLLAETKTTWRGTVMAVFQPGEETAEGAQAMIDDGLFMRFPKPDVVLGQHVMVGPSGTVAGRAGAITSAADSLQIRLFGRGAHGSMPQASIDPVVMAAATVLRLQTIVSREVAAAADLVIARLGRSEAKRKAALRRIAVTGDPATADAVRAAFSL